LECTLESVQVRSMVHAALGVSVVVAALSAAGQPARARLEQPQRA
jgi:hypothetical protein